MIEYDISLIFAIVGITIVIGFLGGRIFKKTSIPDVILILFFGILIGPIFHFFDPTQLLEIGPVFGAVALLIILFNAGLNLDFYTTLREAPRATALGVLGFTFSVIFIAVSSIVFLDIPLSHGILLGSIIGGSSSIIVIPLVHELKIKSKVQTVLALESTITDVLCVVVSLTMISLILGRSGEINAVQAVASRFSTGIVLGLIVGLVWLWIYPRIKHDPYNYMVTLFMAFLLYAFAETLGGSGPLSTLIFGITLGNGPTMSEILKLSQPLQIGEDLKRFHSEISFLIRSFFLVYIGIIVTLGGFTSIVYGLIASGLLLIARYGALLVSTVRSDLKEERGLMTMMLPRGLAAAVLASLPFTMGIKGTDFFLDIAFIVIISTIIISIVGTIIVRRSTSVLPSEKGKVPKMVYDLTDIPDEEDKKK